MGQASQADKHTTLPCTIDCKTAMWAEHQSMRMCIASECTHGPPARTRAPNRHSSKKTKWGGVRIRGYCYTGQKEMDAVCPGACACSPLNNEFNGLANQRRHVRKCKLGCNLSHCQHYTGHSQYTGKQTEQKPNRTSEVERGQSRDILDKASSVHTKTQAAAVLRTPNGCIVRCNTHQTHLWPACGQAAESKLLADCRQHAYCIPNHTKPAQAGQANILWCKAQGHPHAKHLSKTAGVAQQQVGFRKNLGLILVLSMPVRGRCASAHLLPHASSGNTLSTTAAA